MFDVSSLKMASDVLPVARAMIPFAYLARREPADRVVDAAFGPGR
jgi:hypothetical protein